MFNEIFPPTDWEVADKEHWVTDQFLTGDARMPVLEGQDVVGFSELPSEENKESPKRKLTEEDYMEVLRAKRTSQGSNYADSMVFYKGKVMGRCPSGTTRSGRTCIPGMAAATKFPGYKVPDMGGISRAQAEALSKAQSTQDIIKARQKQDQQ